MKIAQIVPPFYTLPLKGYGGIERIAVHITLSLAQQAHQVTVFAAQGSQFTSPNVSLLPVAPFPIIDHMDQKRKWELNEFLKVIEHQDEFDLIHIHFEPLLLQTAIDHVPFHFAQFIHKPVVFTFHNLTYIDQHISFYRSFTAPDNAHFVFISERQRQPLQFLPHNEVIYNGIAVETFDYNPYPQDYLLFLGRITEVKGIVDAIHVASQLGKKLVIAARVDEVDRPFYEHSVQPFINGTTITFVGEINAHEKMTYLKNAKALLFPIHWEEPFGLVMTEAMASGTPIIAYARGSVPEIVTDGQTGYIVDESAQSNPHHWLVKSRGIAGLKEAVEKIYSLPEQEYLAMRQACRQRVERHFSTQKMVDNYLRLYQKILNQK